MKDINVMKIGLNNIYSDYTIYEPATCEHAVDIYTSSACPAKCITYNNDTNSVCQYDDFFCANDNITYSPSNEPTESPSNESTYSPNNEPTFIIAHHVNYYYFYWLFLCINILEI